MARASVVADVTTLDKKLDEIATRVEYLTEEASVASRRQQDRDELMRDVVPIANDAFALLVEQLEEVQEHVDLFDLLRLLKRLLRNGRNVEKLLDQLEGLMDLTQTVGPLADDVFGKATDLLQKAEQRGYFTAAKSAACVLDGVVEEFARGDADPRRKVSLWSLFRQMRDPEVRQGLSSGMRLLKVIGRQTAAKS